MIRPTIEPSKIEIVITLQNVLDHYFLQFSDLYSCEKDFDKKLSAISKCHNEIKVLYTSKKNLFKEEIRPLIKRFISKSEPLNKIITSQQTTLNRISNLNHFLKHKRYIVEYHLVSLKSMLNIS